MKILLDSSFFFPFLKVKVEKVNQEDLLRLIRSQKHDLMRSELTIFEISAKGWKYIYENKISRIDLIDGINTIQDIDRIEVIPIHLSSIQLLAGFFRENHPDFIDCLILASAVVSADMLLTLDANLIPKIQGIWQDEIRKENAKFQAMLWDNFRI